MREPPIDAILIDFYGTISAGDRDAVESACAQVVRTCELDLPAADFAIRWGERFFALIDRSNHDAFRTLYQCELESLRDTLADFGVEADPAPFVAELEAYWADPPVYADALAFLRQVDRPICCVSNADTKPLLQAIERRNLAFDEVVASEQVRCYKPQPDIFLEAASRLGVKPSRLVHIGDSLHSDIAGASRLGIRTIWIQRDRRIHDIGRCKPDITIETLAEVPPMSVK